MGSTVGEQSRFPSLADLSRAEAALAIEANDAAFIMELGRAAGGEERDDTRLRWTIGGSPVDYHNAVVHADLAPEAVKSAIDEVVARFRAHAVPGTWHVGPTTRPADLGRCLRVRGFKGGGADVGMATDLHQLPEVGPVPAGLRIERVRDAADLDAWVQARALDPEGELESRWVADTYLRIGLGDDSAWRHYVGWLDGRPVATASLLMDGATAGVYFVLTVPEARRQGIGAAITQTALREARDVGYRIGVLGASPMGVPVYRRLGFEENCRIAVYEWSGETDGGPAG